MLIRTAFLQVFIAVLFAFCASAAWSEVIPLKKAPAADIFDKADAESGQSEWQELFNGKDLTGWDGDPRFWSVKDGAIHGETTKETPAPNNTFIICRSTTLKDFELRLKYRIRNGNSGIQYRSSEFDRWRIRGYQAEVENNPTKRPLGNSAGFLYDEKGRGELAMIGEFVVIDKTGDKKIVGNVNTRKELLEAKYHNDGDWNDYVIIARGNHFVHYLNGYKTADVIDNDPNAAREGLLALQIHYGNPMAMDFKDIRVRHLDEYPDTRCLFNGKDLTGWVAEEGTWVAEPDGVLQARSGKNIWTEEAFEDFILDLEFKVTKGTNSGVFLRNLDNKKWKHHGMEIQIQDSYGREPGKHSCGALYDCLAPAGNMVYPPGQWNHLRIIAKKNLLDVVMNGERILTADLDLWTRPHLNPDGTKNKFPVAFKDVHRRAGYIGFQGRHNDNQPIWYRNIKITPLKD